MAKTCQECATRGLLRMSDELILETEDLTKDFAGFVAVNGVNLRVRRGTIHALIGPNGAGKTTCFNLLTKFLSPTRGRILFKGDDITDMQAMCFALFACAFNLLIGYVGLLSFGHALYFGWASYLSAYSAKAWGFPPEFAILTGTATAAVCGLVAGSLAIRRQGIYFAMITLALAQMMYFFALQAKFTGGEDGIQAVPRGHLFGIFDLKNEMTMVIATTHTVTMTVFLKKIRKSVCVSRILN